MTTRLLLRHVREVDGDQAVSRVLSRCGMLDHQELLESGRGHVGYAEKLQLFDAAVVELGQPDLGRRLGPLVLDDPAGAHLMALMRAFGSPQRLLQQVARIGTRLDTATVTTCEHTGPGIALVSWTVLPPNRPNRVDCDYKISLFEQVPVVFGLPAAQVEHPTCQLQGEPTCRYLIRWRQARPLRERLGSRLGARRRAVVAASPEPDAVSALATQVQSLHQAALDLVGGHGTTETLDRIAARAGEAVHAHGYALAVRLSDGTVHVRHLGLPDEVAALLVADLAARRHPAAVGGWPVLSVDIASADHDHGALAAVLRPGQAFLAEDQEVLAVYARHAAAALDTAAALDRAHEQEETARKLLGVAQRLARRGSVGEVCQAVADAVPGLTGADRSAVALWDAESGQLAVGASSGWPVELRQLLESFLTTPEESPELAAALQDHQPVLILPGRSTWGTQLLRDFRIQALAAMPITADDAFLGVVVADWAHTTPPTALSDALVTRLAGLASQAAVALDNARLLEQVQRQAQHDPVTGLGNRVLLEQQLPEVLRDATASRTDVALLFCDLDRFKRVNDTLGHAAGDRLLREVAVRLRAVVRRTDTVVRFSGDEFVVLMPDVTGAEEAHATAERIRTALAAPISLGEDQVFIAASIGVAVSGQGPAEDAVRSDAGAWAAQLIALADERMYEMKRRRAAGGAGRRRTGDLLRLEADLRRAAQRGELHVHYQPQLALPSGRIVGTEALVRWSHPDRGLIAPADFIPLAEEVGLIAEIGAFVLREACSTAVAWRRLGVPVEMSVNVSPVQLASAGFADDVAAVLHESGLDPSQLTLEVTESHAVGQTPGGRTMLERLRSLGLGVSVDDFGTGYASLAQLRELPATEVKVDRAFVSELDGSRASEAFIAGVIGLARGLDLRVVAEGVETEVQRQALSRLGCDRAQGYLLGRPADAQSVLDVLRQQPPGHRPRAVTSRAG